MKTNFIFPQSMPRLVHYSAIDVNNNKIEDPGLYSISDLDSLSSEDLYDSEVEEEYQSLISDWQENVHTFKTIFSLLLVPLTSRLIGRRVAIWAWSRLRVHYSFPSFRMLQ